MHYVVTIYMSVLEESATLEAVMSFMFRSMDCRNNYLVFVIKYTSLTTVCRVGLLVCGSECIIMKINVYFFLYKVRMESSRFSVNSLI